MSERRRRGRHPLLAGVMGVNSLITVKSCVFTADVQLKIEQALRAAPSWWPGASAWKWSARG